jgi:hypothetical protein
MPKRTNDFQNLIASIYKQIVEKGGKVTESGMVYDKEADTLREVDVLVECRYAGHDFKIAIECRDRSRKDSVEWIDSLIGKSKSLLVNKVVAVSKEGFTQSAIKKAAFNNIDTLTLEEAIETDWSKYPIKPGIVLITGEKFRLHDVLYKKGDTFRPLKNLDLRSIMVLNGEDCGSIKVFFEYFFLKHLLPFIQTHKMTEIRQLFKTKSDLDKGIYIEFEHNFPETYARLSSGEEVRISVVKFIIIGTRGTKEIEQNHYKFNELMVSMSEHLDSDGSKIKFNILQYPESDRIHGTWKREKSLARQIHKD